MAREIIAWCDAHLMNDPDERVQGAQYVFAINGVERSIDMCDDCFKELVEPLRSLLDDAGQRVHDVARFKPSSEKKIECPMPGCVKRYSNREGLRKHLNKFHDMTLTEVEAQLNSEAGAQALSDTLGTGPYACPEDDCSRSFETPQGLGAHRSRAHGYVSPHTNGGKKAS